MLSGEIKSNYENIWVITVNIKDSRIGGIYIWIHCWRGEGGWWYVNYAGGEGG